MKRYLYILTFIIFNCHRIDAQIINGNFDEGSRSGWTQYSKGGYGLIGTAQFLSFSEADPPVYPRSGQYMARIGGFNYEENYIKQTVTLPNTPKVYLALYYQDRAFTGTECAGLSVGAQIRVYVGNKVVYDGYQCYYNTVNQWTHTYMDISAFAGQTVEIGFRADANDYEWSFLYLDDISITSSLTAVEDEKTPARFYLAQNYPNPFNPVTHFGFRIANFGFVSLRVYDIIGNEVATLVNESKEPGSYEIKFDATKLSSGIYFYKLETGSKILVKKMVLIK